MQMMTALLLATLLNLTPAAEQADVPEAININTAKYSKLLELPGIGRKRALAIVLYRQRRAFRRPVDLLRVEGIGKKLLRKLRPHIRVKDQVDRSALVKR
ncbi:MAG: hypothetical protein CMH60_01280 [Myxococcales bacterium]|nr:hypothetical protein [Myxococcales bacterium]|tara:strand:- start:8111 stop:8410 length:300 start_codon:yes stop_codon:yes gene_type:complete